jgi:tRNA threonylcarbamoyladenosine biosynthesis protein TsaE
MIGRLLKGKAVIELVGDIGSGKTTLTQGLVAGLESSEDVSSPTFTIGRVYPLRNGLELHHFDFYRLDGHDMVTTELAEAIQDPKSIVVVEWAGHGAAQLPLQRLRVTILPQESESDRMITVESLGPELHYVVEDLRRAYRSTN